MSVSPNTSPPQNHIPFNRPCIVGNELAYIQQAIARGHLSGDGHFTRLCHSYFEKQYGFKKTLLTTSCTDALEMAAILINIVPGDEVIIPSFTFVSTANAFVLRGAKVVFIDSESTTPNMDVKALEALITPRTKAIVPVHYAGVACDMDVISQVAKKYGVFLVEDAAQAIHSFYKKQPLGSIGHLAAFSFHETKNISSGEGGMLAINDEQLIKRAEIIREKGTNRSAFFRGEVDKYGWVDVGSSFLPSDMIAAFLYAQLENLERIQQKRISLWKAYYENLLPLQKRGCLGIPFIPPYATNNAHLFYIVCHDLQERTRLIEFLAKAGIHTVFHYVPLHSSKFYAEKHDQRSLPHAERYSQCLLRLPLFYQLEVKDIEYITSKIKEFFQS